VSAPGHRAAAASAPAPGARAGGSALYSGTITHARRFPEPHRFRHRACVYAIDLDEAPALGRRLRLLGVDAPGLVSLHAADHLGDPARGLRANVEELLAAEGLDAAGGRIVLVTNLRVLGYVFNPISCFWCWDRRGDLLALVCEVSNTFGERHLYVLPAADARRRGGHLVWERDKRMHVSPFSGMGQRYRFVATPPGARLALGISVYEGGRRVLHATVQGRRGPLTDRAILRAQLTHPLMPWRVTGLIHVHAARLYTLGVPFHRKPAFRTGEGSLPAPAAPAARRGLHPPPPAGRSPLTPLVRRLSGVALGAPPRGSITTRMPDGTLRRADSGLPGPHPRITVHSRDLWRRFATRGMTGVGEAYVAGDWDADDLPGAVELLLRRSEALRRTPAGRAATTLRDLRPRLPERVSHALARRRIGYHYDLGNDLYRLFLDESMTYSCAVFGPGVTTLADAQAAKHRLICRKLLLRPGQRVLEIGCGWGAWALVAAGEFGVHVTGVTLSEEQHDEAVRRVRAAGLQDRVDILLRDYRTLEGRFDAIASTEMIEAVGHDQLPTYFATLDRLLAADGLACIQAIAMPDGRYDRYRRSRDWISEYVFPGGNCPSLEAMVRAMARSSDLIVHHAEDIGIHYAETLRLWRERFDANAGRVRELGFDEAFLRAWRFYLASCEGAFRARSIHDYQLVLTRPFNDRLPGPGTAAPA
jgi:cyclopropane-fatty-acyl-phospholipid synthase